MVTTIEGVRKRNFVFESIPLDSDKIQKALEYDPNIRRGGRVVEGARLESVYTLTRIEGSNPSLSAINFLNIYIFQMVIYKPLICPPS